MIQLKSRIEVADLCMVVFNSEFLRTLCEPVRIELFRQLLLLGRSDVSTIADTMPQDRSVVTRHLQLMARVGLLRSDVEGRHVFYEIDGATILTKVDDISLLLKQLVPLCCDGTKT